MRIQKGDIRPRLRAGRWITIGLMVSLTLGVSALRGSVETPAKTSGNASSKDAEQVVPFDLSLLNLDSPEDPRVAVVGSSSSDDAKKPVARWTTAGVYAFRVAAILNRPGMHPVRQLINAQVDQIAKSFAPAGLGIHCEDIDQVMGRITIGGENKPGKRSMAFGVQVLRTTRDIDWVKLRDQLFPERKLHVWKGETYVSVRMPPQLRVLGPPGTEACFWAPDARTLVFDSEDTIKRLIEARKGGRQLALPAYTRGWERVSTGLFAIAVDNRDQRLLTCAITEEEKKAITDKKSPEHFEVVFAENVSRVLLGVSGQDDLRCDLWAAADTAARAADMAKACKDLLAATRKELAEDHDKGDRTFTLGLAKELLKNVAVHRQDRELTVHTEIANGLKTLLAEIAKDVRPQEAKQK